MVLKMVHFSLAQTSQHTRLSPWTGCSLFWPVVSFHLEQGEAMRNGAKGIPQVSCSGEDQEDMSHWDGGSVLGTVGQRSLRRGPSCVRRRPRSVVVLSQIPSVHPPATFSYPSLGTEKRALHLLLEKSTPFPTCVSSYSFPLSPFCHSCSPFFVEQVLLHLHFPIFQNCPTFYASSCPQHSSLLIHLLFSHPSPMLKADIWTWIHRCLVSVGRTSVPLV